MQVFIRAYGSHLMGMGHLYRIQKLVHKLKGKVSKIHITLFTQKYEEAKAIYKNIEYDEIIEIEPNIDINKEIKLLQDILSQKNYDICINDQLNTEKKIAYLLTQKSNKNITFDDIGEGNILFDYIVNVLYPTQKDLKNEINSYEYMILNDFSELKKSIKFSKIVKKIFINQGAADTWGAIPDIIQDLNALDIDITLKVLLGPSFQDFTELGDVLKKVQTKIEIFNFTDNVIELVKDCDLAILGAGNTLFEVASLGIPIIASTREEKELITIRRLLKDNIVYAENKLYEDSLNNLVKYVISDSRGRKAKFEQNRKLFTYNGLDKIIDIMLGETR